MAIRYILETIQAAWKKGKVATVLSLDMAGAFDKVHHERLIHNLRERRIPKWITDYVLSFLTERSTTIAIPGYESPLKPTQCGIPQGSTISPILFLFFTADLLQGMRRTEAVGYADDTYLISVHNSTK